MCLCETAELTPTDAGTHRQIDVVEPFTAHVVGTDKNIELCSSGLTWSACVPQERHDIAKGDTLEFSWKLAKGLVHGGIILWYAISAASAGSGSKLP